MLALANRRRAAAALVAMGPERAAALLRNFDPEEIEALAGEIASVGTLPAEEINRILREIAEEVVGRRLAAEGGLRYAQEVLERVMGPEKAREIVERIDPVRVRPFNYLAMGDPDVVARVLAAEPPASVALALAHIDTDAAARILVKMPPEVSADVAIRLAALEYVHPDVVAEVDADFSRRLLPMLTTQLRPVPGIETLVGVLNRTSRETERALLEAIEAQQPELAMRIRDALFVFDDIVRLDDRAIQQVLRSVDTRELAVALKGAGEEVRDAILRNLSERARENLLEEIEFLKGVRPSDIREAQTQIVRTIRALEEAGTITIERGDGEELA